MDTVKGANIGDETFSSGLDFNSLSAILYIRYIRKVDLYTAAE